MTNEATINKLLEMRMSTMADTFRSQLDDPSMNSVPFEDRFGLIVDMEYDNRKNNRLQRLIRNASLDQPQADISDINYKSGHRHLCQVL